jgi:hypothetical protein
MIELNTGMKRYMLLIFSCLLLTSAIGQPKKYTTANAHSHNDYEQAKPFFSAYAEQFGSIEADVFSIPGSDFLLVGHEQRQIQSNPRTLDSLYLVPIVNALRLNNGYPYADKTRQLQLMIDIKTGAEETLEKLIRSMEKYPAIINNHSVHIVISGNKPATNKLRSYPAFIQFDGNLADTISEDQMKHVGMISSSFETYSKWKGAAEFPAIDRTRLQADIDRAHAAGKKVRLWAIPDLPVAWDLMKQLGVDYINTDKIEQLATFLNPE